ncbi:MAG: hypothetical protein M5U31_04415 [Acidimicrobiia bacterium]|nr:hypothetical protein [Acidimicrobiia bacterium]
MAGDAAELCMSLMRADSEDEVVGLLEAAGYWDDPRYWRFLDDNEGNYSAIGNQQGEAVAALIEKLVNAVDARLTNACFEAGIDPTSAEAPQSMREAVARFFEHSAHPGAATRDESQRGLQRWSPRRGSRSLTATGSMPQAGNPSLSIADSGEGQAPDSFPDTFMSLERNNKLRVQFVQGKFNMGGTGAFQFSSHDHRLQLIVSRRNPSLLSPEAPDRDAEWGFTVVRREAGDSGSRNSVYTYLAPVGVALGRDGASCPFRRRSGRSSRRSTTRGATPTRGVLTTGAWSSSTSIAGKVSDRTSCHRVRGSSDGWTWVFRSSHSRSASMSAEPGTKVTPAASIRTYLASLPGWIRTRRSASNPDSPSGP